MARLARVELFAPDEIAVVHVMNRVVRRCFLMGDDPVSGKNYDHRKHWIEDQLRRCAALFGIDLLAFAILDNHFHLVLRSRPDVVREWSDEEVARRWRLLCPYRKHADGTAREPSQAEVNSITTDPDKLRETRQRLSDISWWMRLLCQRIAQRANKEDDATGKFWENRYRAVRLLDEEALLACSAYVDLNPIRAGLAKTVEDSDHTSAQRRIQSLATCDANERVNSTRKSRTHGEPTAAKTQRPDSFLSPVQIDELRDALGARRHKEGVRCSDKGYLAMPIEGYLELLDWTARRIVPGKSGNTRAETPPIFDRLKIKPAAWQQLVTHFGQLFSQVAGQPHHVDEYRSRLRRNRFHMPASTRQLLAG